MQAVTNGYRGRTLVRQFFLELLFRRASPDRYHPRAQSLSIQVAQKPVEELESFASSAKMHRIGPLFCALIVKR
jgi:hypothetical protein